MGVEQGGWDLAAEGLVEVATVAKGEAVVVPHPQRQPVPLPQEETQHVAQRVAHQGARGAHMRGLASQQ